MGFYKDVIAFWETNKLIDLKKKKKNVEFQILLP